MAATKNNEEVRKQALDSMAAGRTEIRNELQRLRLQLSPARNLHRMVDRHTGLVVMGAVAAGLVPVLMVFPGKPSHHRATRPAPTKIGDPPAKPLMTGLLVGGLGLLAKAVTPAMVKSVIVSPLFDLLARKQVDPAHRRPKE